MENDIKKDQYFWHFVTASIYGVLTLLFIFILWKINRIPRSISAFDFWMITLATFRITRLLVHDLVSDFIREPFKDAESGIKKSIHDLLDCPWCTGTWVALIVSFFYFVFPISWPIILIMGVSGVGTLLTILASLMMVRLKEK